LLCNISSLLPLIEEPTKDINATLALGFISFFYVQGHAIAHHGFIEYAKGFLEPFFIMLPLNLLGTLTSIISLSFRLFGNIFGGYTITSLYHTLLSQSIFYELIGVCSGFNLFMSVVFTLFEGTMQAFVFSMLSLTFLSMEISSESENNEGISA
jgi:F-type H+-transporting ATPase subunit a